MAALDFGMALSRGMLPTSEKAQQDLLNLAGGRNIFKSEDWWQKQVDEQISSGYRKYKEEGREFLLPSGEYQLGRRNVSVRYTAPYANSPFGNPYGNYGPMQPSAPTSPMAAAMGGWTAQTSINYEDPTGGRALSSRTVPVYEGRTYFTGGELSEIEAAAKRGAEQAKRASAESKKSTRRLARGTGGLVAKAVLPGEKPATGLPSLGDIGLGLTTTALGKGLEL